MYIDSENKLNRMNKTIFIELIQTKLLIIIGIILLFKLSQESFAQSYQFKSFSKTDQLNQLFIYDIEQDKNGYLYIATGDGLVIYDGINLSLITTKNGISENLITSLFIDSKNRVWLGHFQNGVSLYTNDSIIKFNTGNLKNIKITSFVEDINHNLWVGTYGGGIFKIDSNLGIKQIESTKNLNVSCLNLSKDNSLLVGKDDGIDYFSIKNSELIETNKNRKFAEGIAISKIIQVPRMSSYLATTHNDGILLFHLQDGNLTKNKRFKSPFNDQNPSINDITVSKNGELWISTPNKGIYKLNFNDPLYPSALNINVNNGLITNNINCIFSDIEGNVWIGSYGNGLIKFLGAEFIQYNFSESPEVSNVTAITKSPNATIWIGSENGLFTFNPDISNEALSVTAFKQLKGKHITTLHYSSSGLLWIGTANNGAYSYNLKSNNLVHLNSTYHLSCDHVNTIAEGIDNTIYLGSSEGLFIYSPSNNKFTRLTTQQGLPHNAVTYILPDSKNRIWIASHGSPIYFFKNQEFKTFKDIPGLKSYNLNCIVEDKKGHIWFGSEGDGLFQFDGNDFIHYSNKNGLTSDYCYSLVVNNKNELFVGHKNGITKVSNGKCFIYSKETGIPSKRFNLNSVYTETNNLIWFGTESGLLKYNSAEDNINRIPVTVTIKSLKNDTLNLPLTTGLSLLNGDYSLRFDFVGISLTAPENVKYKYMLEGFDNQWHDIQSNNSITFPKLNYGKYNFKLKACNSSGIWNESPTEFQFTIDKPFWLKWWFYTLSAIILFILIVLIIRWRTSQLINANKILEEKVEEKTHVINQEKAIIEANTRLIESQRNNIVDSINYAKGIQEAMLPIEQEIQTIYSNCFIYNNPKDIVSGDYYWFQKSEDKIYFSVADCTGHGVPGAFMSFIGSLLLSQTIDSKGFQSPGEILNTLDYNIRKYLKQNTEKSLRDGMEMVLCQLDLNNRKLRFASAMRPLYLIRNGELIQHKGSRYTVGGFHDDSEKIFSNQEIDIENGDLIYLSSDGYPDQFGGPRNKKFSTKKFKEYLISIAHLPIHEQKLKLSEHYDIWKGDEDQIDDVLVLGMKFQF
jgi:ligand-binding sensor domain-containing protein/serine phosphatase RsbU (regulator of sigma subunit)